MTVIMNESNVYTLPYPNLAKVYDIPYMKEKPYTLRDCPKYSTHNTILPEHNIRYLIRRCLSVFKSLLVES